MGFYSPMNYSFIRVFPSPKPFQVSRGDDQRRPAVLGGLVRCSLEAQQVLHHREVAIIGRNVPGRKPWEKRGKNVGTLGFCVFFSVGKTLRNRETLGKHGSSLGKMGDVIGFFLGHNVKNCGIFLGKLLSN